MVEGAAELREYASGRPGEFFNTANFRSTCAPTSEPAAAIDVVAAQVSFDNVNDPSVIGSIYNFANCTFWCGDFNAGQELLMAPPSATQAAQTALCEDDGSAPVAPPTTNSVSAAGDMPRANAAPPAVDSGGGGDSLPDFLIPTVAALSVGACRCPHRATGWHLFAAACMPCAVCRPLRHGVCASVVATNARHRHGVCHP